MFVRPSRDAARLLAGAMVRDSACWLMAFGAAVAALTAAPAAAQQVAPEPAAQSVHGQVLDSAGRPVAGARIEIAGQEALSSDRDGRFTQRLRPGAWSLEVEHGDFRPLRRQFVVGNAPLELELRLEPLARISEAVTVVGIRADADTPVTARNLDRREIETLAYGQDAPALLQHTPSMTWYSDSGTGANYSYFSLRGIQQSRINMTYDGAPLNDPAEHVVYFNNFSDFVNEVDSIQIQRGVGTSSVGAPSYGGSVNFASRNARNSGGGDIRLVLGSYATARASIGYGSGRVGNGFHIAGRFSYASTDGYRERSGTEHNTLFLNAGWQGERSSLKLTGFSGTEKSQLAYLAVEPEILAVNRRFNPLGPEDRDNFGQDFVQARYTHGTADETLITASLYYNGAAGWFGVQADPSTLTFGIDQHFVGSMVTASKRIGAATATAGIHYNDFAGEHTLEFESNRLYSNVGRKQTANAFAKAEARTGNWLLFGDLQLRWARFGYDGDVDLGAVDWTFLDPRLGARYFVAPALSVYAAAGRAQREPARLDLLLGEDNATAAHDLGAVKPESVIDLEAGFNYDSASLRVQANVYAMEFRDEIALTGELTQIGLPLRRNVDRSYRRGVEIDLRWRPAPSWSLLHSLNLSRNRIQEWTQYYDVFDPTGAWIGSEPITYRDVRPLLSPELVGNLAVEWAQRRASIALIGRFVSRSQLDNTGLERFRLPSYTNVDLRASLGLGRLWPDGRPRLTLFVNNLFDDDGQYPNGYSYQYLARDGAGGDTLAGTPFYYPLATRNVVVSLSVDL